MKKNDLSIKLKSVYNFASMYYDKNGYPPSIREICKRLSIKSTSTVYSYLSKLKKKGFIETQPFKKRTIQLPLKKENYKKIPILNKINDKAPYLSIDNIIGYCPIINEFNLTADSFAIKMLDESMTSADLLKNDLLIINNQRCAKNGDIVMAIFNEKITIRRFIVDNGNVYLRSENKEIINSLYDKVKLLGVVKGIIRKL